MDRTLTKLTILCKVCLVKCLNLKHRQRAWSVSSETTGDIINIKNVKKQETVLSFEMYWSSIARKNTRTWLTYVIISNKFNFSLITA